mmetsp:Transcript_51123/g.146788  ORF Transcript_51123/g.146788 Transcript_51123/m.146788 type:complete len:314 (-) Transcript_51123:112-1053(-)
MAAGTMAAAREAKEHMALAEKALKTSWIGLKFAPDHLSASMEFANAATKFRSANMMEYAVAAWVRSAEMKEKLSDLFGAGRAYESAGAICDGTGPGGPKAAAKNWEKAIRCFRLCAKGDIAAKLILKRAESLEKDGDVDGAKVAFEEAIEVFKEDEKDYQLGDVYKQYIGFLVRSNRVDDTAKAMDGHVEILVRNKHYPFAHKDVVRADQALQPGIAVEGWFMSKESQVGSELVEAFQAHDAENAERLLKEQVFTFLQVEVARLAKKLKVPDFGAQAAAGSAGVAATSGARATAAAPVAAEPVTAADMAEMLM